MAPQYPRTLQTALDDTLGPPSWRQKVLETRPHGFEDHKDAAFVVSRANGNELTPVYEGSGHGPDLGTVGLSRMWVKARSVRGRGKTVIRPIADYELQSIWDYEGKLESLGWHNFHRSVLPRRVRVPPAKMLRSLAFTVGELCLEALGVEPKPLPALEAPRQTHLIPFSPLEKQATTRVKAAQADDAEVDLTTWAIPGETMAEAAARQVLRKFAVKWWKLCQVRSA